MYWLKVVHELILLNEVRKLRMYCSIAIRDGSATADLMTVLEFC